MGVFADTINGVDAVLKAAILPAQPLAYFKKVHFGELDQITTLAMPGLWLHLDEPAIAEDWNAAQDIRDNLFTMLINVAIEMQDQTKPYGVTGDTNKRGILVAVADVMNEIDNKRSTILGANGKNFDLNLGVRTVRNIGHRTFEGIVTVVMRQRYPAAGR